MTFRFFLLAVVLLAPGIRALADDAAFLAAHGHPAPELTWTEVLEGRLVTGFRLPARPDGGITVVYRDGDRLLSAQEAEALGIPPKSFAPSTASAATERPAPATPAQPPAPRPRGLDLPGNVEVLALAPYAPAKSIEPGGPEKPANQIGDIRTLPVPVSLDGKSASLGGWQALPGGGQVWRAGVLSPGATGQRLHLAAYALPEGGVITVYNPDRPDEAFTAEGTGAALWLPTIYNEQSVIEVFLPALGEAALLLDRLVHIYATPGQIMKAAGACNNDVTCFPAWADTALGVCGLGVVTTSGALFCTGTLIADSDDCTVVPYVLTANHCVGGQNGSNGASSLEFYWFYQTAACNGAPPSLPFVPRTTGGADYLAGAGGTGFSGGGNDFTLLRMRNAPHANATYVGWTAADPPLGTDVTCIHHPDGDFKRISFADLTDIDNDHAQYYHESLWFDGTTEPGSSGSPLMLTATQQIIGQLWGGLASCAVTDEPDYYGKFSVTHAIAGAIIDPGPVEAAFAAATLNASEADTNAVITVTLSRPAAAPGITVDYDASPGTAIPGNDFTPVNGTLSYPAGEDTATFSIPLAQDLRADNGITVLLTLSNASCGVPSPTLGTATLAILDDDPDTDGDGLSDFDEINGTFGPPTDPGLADSDGDGLDDHQEIFDPYGYDTDPNNPDTDGDEIPDFLEILFGTDPTVFDSIGLGSVQVPWLD